MIIIPDSFYQQIGSYLIEISETAIPVSRVQRSATSTDEDAENSIIGLAG
jgi:hypothetical protein